MATRQSSRLAASSNASPSKKVHFVDNVQISLRKCDNISINKSKNMVPNSPNKSLNGTRLTRNSAKEFKNETPTKKRKNANIKETLSPVKLLPKKEPKHKSPVKCTPKKTEVKKEKPSTPTKASLQYIGKSDAKLKTPLKTKTRIRQQMKLGRIFVKPTFPLKSILKKNIDDDKKEKQGHSVAAEINTKRLLQPKIVLRKIDPDISPVREPRQKRCHR